MGNPILVTGAAPAECRTCGHVGCCDSSRTDQKRASFAADKVDISTPAAISRHAFFDTIGPKPSCNL